MTVKQSTEQIPFIDLAAQYESIAGEIEQAMSGVLRRADFILGSDVQQFEKEFAEYSETSFAVSVDSGTSAIEMALRAYGIGPGDEVVTVANSFIATALAISYTGARPVDVDPLKEQGISAGIHYPVPIHLQPAYHELGYPIGSFPVTEGHARQLLSLPMYPELTANQVERVASAVAAFAGQPAPGGHSIGTSPGQAGAGE